MEMVVCPRCNGEGNDPRYTNAECIYCYGDKAVTAKRAQGYQDVLRTVEDHYTFEPQRCVGTGDGCFGHMCALLLLSLITVFGRGV